MKTNETYFTIMFAALVKLFELRIIGCAVGDFSRSPGPAMLFKRVHDPNLNIQVRCGCKGIEVPGRTKSWRIFFLFFKLNIIV